MAQCKRRWSDFGNQTILHKLEIILVFFTFATVFFAVMLILFWATYPYKTIVVKNAKMATSTVRQGEITTYSIDYVKWMKSDYVRRFFVDGLIFDAGEFKPIRPVGAEHGVTPIQIPGTLPPGTYRLRVVITFKPNPIRTIDYTFETDKFKVLESIANANDIENAVPLPEKVLPKNP